MQDRILSGARRSRTCAGRCVRGRRISPCRRVPRSARRRKAVGRNSAQQPLEPAPVIRFEPHGCVQGESAAGAPLFHIPEIVFVQYPAPLVSPQDAAPNPHPYRPSILRSALLDRDETRAVARIVLEYPVDDADMEVRMQVEREAEAMDEGHRAGACIRPCARAPRAPVAFDLVEEDAQGGIEGLAVMVKAMALPLGQGLGGRNGPYEADLCRRGPIQEVVVTLVEGGDAMHVLWQHYPGADREGPLPPSAPHQRIRPGFQQIVKNKPPPGTRKLR